MSEMDGNGKDARLAEVGAWLAGLAGEYGLELESLRPASADASFRRYFRVAARGGRTLIVMDAPPPQEDIRPFLKVDGLMREAGLNAPEVYASDAARGFILMSDLGTQTYLDVLDEDNAARLMDAATTALVRWQAASREGVLPPYDAAALRRELDLFPQWYVLRHRGYMMTPGQLEAVNGVFEKLVARSLAQPRVFVHRDFMPRNLMVSDPMPGIIDFQDALMGPVSYDIMSLMRDAFVSWGEAFVLDVTIRYWEKARKAGIPVPADFAGFWQDVEWMGMQRHLKVLGIFARINYRDGKPKYLADTPRFIHYVRQCAGRYGELRPINWLLDQFEEAKSKEAFY
ncbi:MAG: phosphotransferase [Duodenibacillus sp.]|nr:phosphotransferase [Duodenibacillus sp.]